MLRFQIILEKKPNSIGENMVYYINFLLLAINSVGERVTKSKYFLFFDLALLTMLAGFRGYHIGFDTYTYVYSYQSLLNHYGSIYGFEKGYVFLERVGAFFHLSPGIFLSCIAFVSIGFLIIGFSDLTPLVCSVLLYYYSRYFLSREMNQIRAALAAAVILFSLRYVARGRLWEFVLCILCVSLIHKAAYMAIIIYPVNYFIWHRLKDKKKIIKLYVFTLIVAAVCSIVLSGQIAHLFSSMGESTYVETDPNSNNSQGLANPIIFLQLIVSLLGLSYIVHDEMREQDQVMITTYIISTLLLILLSQHNTLAGRVSTLFATVEPVLVLRINNTIFKGKLSYASFIVISLIIFHLCSVKSINTVDYTPYIMFF